ncbi:MAG: hypothetical protein WA885_15735 [Phormidesmis sp.]
MNTPAHAIFNLAILGRKQRPDWNPLIIWGALIPDLAMFGFYLWYQLATDMPERQIWSQAYFLPSWQLLFDLFNSIPLALGAIALTLYFHRTGIALLFTSILLHCLEDLPLHNDDAHRHFLPFSNFRFESPVSYWDSAHYGQIVGTLELGLMLIASIYVFKRVRSRWTKGLIISANALPLLVYLYFSIRFGTS